MQTAGLSFQQAPPIDAPLRFFLTAPLFVLAAGALLAWGGPDFLTTRWHPRLMGLVHLLTLGYMASIMIGALLQMMPVVAGAPVARPTMVARAIHLPVMAGATALAIGLMLPQNSLLVAGASLLGLALLSFAIVVLVTLRRAPAGNVTALGMRLAALALAVTAALGVMLVSNHVLGWWLADRETWTNLHLTWGLAGWAGLLIIGVSQQVVPMFQVTPEYPSGWSRRLLFLQFGLLTLLTVAALAGMPLLPLALALALALLVYPIMTLHLQLRRRRRLPDVTVDFFRVGLLSLVAAIALWCLTQLFPPPFPAGLNRETVGLLLGVLVIPGFLLSLIGGMLYKIVPFLVWFHLQSRRPRGQAVPNMKSILPEARARGQWRAHILTLTLLLAAVLWPPAFTHAAAVALMASAAWQWWNLVSAYRHFHQGVATRRR